jgi:glutamate-1-semialdehyde 2,1-aminomutase
MPRPIAGPRSRRLHAAAAARIPGGVNSPVRAWKRLGGNPPTIASGKGAWITDADGHRYVDYVLSWGPLLVGHAHPKVLAAVKRQMAKGLGFGAPSEPELEMAELLHSALPSLELVRLVSSGTEAAMSALRVARAATGRRLVVKCDGCYHGHADPFLVAAGSGCATLNTPDSAGVPTTITASTLSVPYNDLAAATALFAQHGKDIAAFCVEPVAGNMGLVLPKPGYLEGLRALCDRHGALLVFDEVMTGFRVAWGGWQKVIGVTPDLTCLGKVIGGGLPVAAYGGKRSVMEQVAPLGPCYQAGTLSGNPVAVSAGLATLKLAQQRGFYEQTTARLTGMISDLRDLADRAKIPVQFGQAGTMWGYFFNDAEVIDWTTASRSHGPRWQAFATAMYRAGVYLAPSPYEAAFWSSAHGPAEIAHTLKAAKVAFRAAATV